MDHPFHPVLRQQPKKRVMKRILAFLALCPLLLISQSLHAKVWRVNNGLGVAADFNSGTAAIASPSVVDGDTLHFEANSIPYAGFELSKRLVIIGTGYFLSGTNSNPGLQADPNSATFSGGLILFDSTASGSTLIGLDNFQLGIGPSLGSATDNITLTRCRITTIGTYYGSLPNTKMTGWKVNKCYISDLSLSGSAEIVQNWEVTNNIFTGQLTIGNPANLNNLVRNNVLRGSINLFSAYFANNIISSNISFVATNVSVKNNICIGLAPAGLNVFIGSNGNIDNQTDAAIFQGLTGNSNDGQWRLKAGSAAISAGETIAGITPDCGAFGTADPYKLSGIPPIPTIYSLTVPPTISSSATTMPITISTKSNN
jgi:hypothetical protein